MHPPSAKIKRKYSKSGFTLAEIVVGIFVFTLFAAGLFATLIHFSRVIERNYNLATAIEISDEMFKEMRSASYVELLDQFGLTSDSTVSSSDVNLGTTPEGFAVSGEAAPNTAYGNTVADSVLVSLTIAWVERGGAVEKEFAGTFFNRGITQ